MKNKKREWKIGAPQGRKIQDHKIRRPKSKSSMKGFERVGGRGGWVAIAAAGPLDTAALPFRKNNAQSEYRKIWEC